VLWVDPLVLDFEKFIQVVDKLIEDLGVLSVWMRVQRSFISSRSSGDIVQPPKNNRVSKAQFYYPPPTFGRMAYENYRTRQMLEPIPWPILARQSDSGVGVAFSCLVHNPPPDWAIPMRKV
jgi:hypothetical protein